LRHGGDLRAQRSGRGLQRGEFLLRGGDRGEAVGLAAQLLHQALAPGHVAHERHEAAPAAVAQAGHGQFHRDAAAVGAGGDQFDPAPLGHRRRAFQLVDQVGEEAALQLAAEQAIAQAVAEGVLARPAEQAFGTGIEFHHDAAGIEGEHGIEGQLFAAIGTPGQHVRIQVGMRQVGTRGHPALHARTIRLPG